MNEQTKKNVLTAVRNVWGYLSDEYGGKGEAVATLHDDGYWTWKKGTTPPYESNYAGWRMDVYAAPQAIGKGEAVAKVANFMFKGVKPTSHVTLLTDELLPDGTLLYTAPQAECAPREAFPYQKTFDAIAAATTVTGGHISISVIKFREAFAPTPERAQESAGVRLSASQLGELYHTARNADSFRSFQKVTDEILAAI